jgi:long-chain acyl-CoA synthetase
MIEGYWNRPDATRELFTAQGWLRTGDVGELEHGTLRLVDRARDFIVTSGGKTLSPSFIENLLRASPYVAEAMVIGHGRKYVTALVEIDADTAPTGHAAMTCRTGFTSPSAMRRSPSDGANRSDHGELARVEQIKVRILPKMLDQRANR